MCLVEAVIARKKINVIFVSEWIITKSQPWGCYDSEINSSFLLRTEEGYIINITTKETKGHERQVK